MRGFALPTDGQGFEPWVRYERTHAFQACALNHSAIHPENYIFYCFSVYLPLPATRTRRRGVPRRRVPTLLLLVDLPHMQHALQRTG